MTQPAELTDLDIPLFTSQLKKLNQCLRAFQANLKTESDLLKQNDPDKIAEHAKQKSVLLEEVNAAFSAVDSTLENNLNQTPPSFMALAQQKAFQPLSETLQQEADETLTLSQACSDLNDANGIAIQILNNINQTTIQILAGSSDLDLNLYGSSGETRSSKSGTTLGKA